MINKSKVRQAALNLIYAIEENGGNIADFDLNLFWEIAQEKETDTYRKPSLKPSSTPPGPPQILPAF